MGDRMPQIIQKVLTTFVIGCIIPTFFCILYLNNLIAWTTFKLLIALYIGIFIIFPIVFKYSCTLQRKAVFLNFVNLPSLPYDNPSKFGLENSRNFYVDNEDVRLGVWHILPKNSTLKVDNSNLSDETLIGTGDDIIIYYHGNAGSRGTSHRVELYKVLRQYFHVIAFDYRSYGDSTNVQPSEYDIVKDCIFMYKWVLNKTKSESNIFVWGHSLGTSLSTQSLRFLQQEHIRPTGLILEAPFNNMKEEISEFPLAKIFKHLPWFTYTIVEPIQNNNFKFETDKHILYVDTPILILHAQDDNVVPYKLGKKLYEIAKENRRQDQGSVSFITFEARHKYGHKYIFRDPGLPDIIRNFVTSAKNEVVRKNLI